MYKAKLKKAQKELLIELLVEVSKADGNVSYDEMTMIKDVEKSYRLKNYQVKHLSFDEIYESMLTLSNEEKKDLIVHAILLAMVDGDFSKEEETYIKRFFDLLDLEAVAKVQKLIDQFGNLEYDIKKMILDDPSEKGVLKEAIEMLKQFSNTSIDDLDENSVLLMKKGPVKKVWDKVLNLWDFINNPKNSKAKKAIAIGAIVYLITPIDVIPDFIPIAGLTDDVAVITYAASQLFKK